MASWGDLGSHTGFRTVPSGGFPCGFSIAGCLGSLHEAGQAVGLRGRRAYRAVCLGLKSHGTHKGYQCSFVFRGGTSFEPIGLLRFRRNLDSFANCPLGT